MKFRNTQVIAQNSNVKIFSVFITGEEMISSYTRNIPQDPVILQSFRHTFL